ncbi:MAG TPA: UDP-glucose--hexose-1-phosphate uridylyltransferase [Candidatus Acutalibacter ornithocaccae]|uniref:Galactose-1-phosphate uridylyltransferase n=1 Tax=Candidatus Acutalibacter ornithocaccae TaxID=2838416 RepID=A0A9D2RZ97_9FIRM|nr:UDP-glucose--hexose-1-phosphate uridylyltransferase [Candidatus Acutalibacter ornithocaccae]
MEKTNTNVEISRLLEYGLQRGLIAPEDKAYAANRMLALLGLREFEPQPVEEELHTPVEPLERLCQFAAEAGLIEPDTRDGRDQFDTELMNCLMPRPSQVVGEFYSLYEKDKQAATDYYYQLARSSNYIRVDRIEKDRMWTAPTPYGDLVITINLSKPEKDPKAIAAAKNAPQSGYPKCALCRENEGYLGSANQAARGNHRLIPLELGGEPWFLQYSPYVYYNEHCIVLSHEHRPMKVSRQSISRLLEFVTFLPHYFVGSNADLPIVGGSILTHDHFQGGRYEFPMAKAPIREKVCFPGFEDVEAGIVHWPMSVIRLRGKEAQRLVDLADKILTAWREYSDESAEILAYTEGTPHNTITPIARRRGEDYELDLVLRNNRTTPEHPLGLFHPHAEYHHIKKENIGLIEVMGLAILPPRLLTETGLLEQALKDPAQAQEIMARPEMKKHQAWYEELKAAGAGEGDTQRAIQESIGVIFGKILGNAGVYKDTEEGREAFRRFCSSL